jgi:poly-gamma-glutamate synthesis protein (capsule biosynthesis protein)
MLSTQLNLNQRIGVVATFDIDLSAETPVVTNPIAHLTYMHYDWTAQQEAAGDLLSRNNLSLNLLANSADLLATTRFQSASVQQILEQMTAILGPEVTVVAD